MDKLLTTFLGVILILALASYPVAGDLNCNFDKGWCEWSNDVNNCFNWTIDNGGTTDKTSGPESDHTTGSSNGSYAVIYGRQANNPSCTATLGSPLINVQANWLLSFWYHMNGNGIGNLTVYSVSNGHRQNIWQKSGRQGPNWLQASIPINAGSHQIKFEATAKFGYGSDLAIDDIAMQTALSSTKTTTLAPATTVRLTSLPINCNFDKGLCGLHIDNYEDAMVSWVLKNGTESFGNFTFIKGDNTTGTGFYLTLNVNDQSAMNGDKSNLNLPVVQSQKMACLTFAYNLPSHTSGSIQIFQTDIQTNEATLVRQVSGYHGLHWESTFVQFYPSKDPFKVVIEGSFSGEPACIVAIDDLSFVEGICKDFVTTTIPKTPLTTPKSTSKGTTSTTIKSTSKRTTPTTPVLLPVSVRETTSCGPEYLQLLNDSSCDFTTNICTYSQKTSSFSWYRENKSVVKFENKIPARTNTPMGYYLATNFSNTQLSGVVTLQTPLLTDNLICLEFWYSLAGYTSSNLQVEIENAQGQVAPVWNAKGGTSTGSWNKRSFIINYRENYKILFSSSKRSAGLTGIDDIHIYIVKPTSEPTSKPSTLTISSTEKFKTTLPISSSPTKLTSIIYTTTSKATTFEVKSSTSFHTSKDFVTTTIPKTPLTTPKSTSKGTTSTTIKSTSKRTTPTTPVLLPVSVRETTSCGPEYLQLLNDSSCDFTTNICTYSQKTSSFSWYRENKSVVKFENKIPARTNTPMGYYLATNFSNTQLSGVVTLQTPLLTDNLICLEFWYSLAGYTSSNLQVEIENAQGQVAPVWNAKGGTSTGSWNKRSFIINYRENYKILFSSSKRSAGLTGIDDIHIYIVKPTSEPTSKTSTLTISSTEKFKTTLPISSSPTKLTSIIYTTTSKATTFEVKSSTSFHTTSENYTTETKLSTLPKSSTISISTKPASKATTSSTTTTGQLTTTQHTSSPTPTKLTSIIYTTTPTRTTSGDKSSTSSQTKQILTTKSVTTVPATTIIVASTTHQDGALSTEKTKPTTEYISASDALGKTKNTTKNPYTTISTRETTAKPNLSTQTQQFTEVSIIQSSHSHATPKIKPGSTTQVTKKTSTTKNILTKTDKNTSDKQLSKGAQVGVGLTVSLVAVGVVIALFFLMKNKKTKRKTANMNTEEAKMNEIEMTTHF